MKISRFAGILAIAVSAFTSPLSSENGNVQSDSASELIGLWEAKRRFGPDISGKLILIQGETWIAEIAGFVAQPKVSGDAISFELENGKGRFQGRLDANREKITGFWIQERTVESDVDYASPVALTKYSEREWRGNVLPINDAHTFYLMIQAGPDGSIKAFLRNPERNVGLKQYKVDHLERVGEKVSLYAEGKNGEKERLTSEGRYYAEAKRLTIYFPTRGGTYDFRKLTENEPSSFYPRGRPDAVYRYMPPPALDDGWKTGSVEEVGISSEGIEKFIRMIIHTPMDSVSSPQIHGVLIARNGKLVVEEYFHGEHREKPHDLRSASKSIASDLTGAAIHAGIPVSRSTPVYQIMNSSTFPPDLDPRKRALTLEHLLSMRSGLDCDEEDENSPGNEENLRGPDLYQYSLNLKMVRDPGSKAVYCSINSNLTVGVIARSAKKHSLMLIHDLLAEPLNIQRYYIGLSPLGEAYMGGGARFLPRDFMKFGQLHLSGGTWNGRQIFTPEWSRQATSTISKFSEESRAGYGYLWWTFDYPYKDRKVRAFFASGNGGQQVIGIPELDLVIAIYGANYNDWETAFKSLLEYVPNHILPAIQE